jgi:hypothetical protein
VIISAKVVLFGGKNYYFEKLHQFQKGKRRKKIVKISFLASWCFSQLMF